MNEDLKRSPEEEATAENYRVILCGANSYEKKYYFNAASSRSGLHLTGKWRWTRRKTRATCSMTRSAQSS